MFAGRVWWDVVLSHALPAGARPSFVAIRSAGRVTALLPILRTGRRLTSLTTPYTCEYTPLFAAGLDQPARVAAMATFGALCRPSGVVRLDALPAEWEHLGDLRTGARQAGLRTLRFDHFGNWREDVANLDWSAYLHGRPGALRETIRRRLRRAETTAGCAVRPVHRPRTDGPGGGSVRIRLSPKLEGPRTLSHVQRRADPSDRRAGSAAARRLVDRAGRRSPCNSGW